MRTRYEVIRSVMREEGPMCSRIIVSLTSWELQKKKRERENKSKTFFCLNESFVMRKKKKKKRCGDRTTCQWDRSFVPEEDSKDNGD